MRISNGFKTPVDRAVAIRMGDISRLWARSANKTRRTSEVGIDEVRGWTIVCMMTSVASVISADEELGAVNSEYIKAITQYYCLYLTFA